MRGRWPAVRPARGRVLAGAVALIAACGSGVHRDPAADAPGTCSLTGGGHLDGTVMGQALAPVAAAHVHAAGSGAAIVLDDSAAATCATPSSTGYHLSFALCAAPMPGSHRVVAAADLHCPTTDVTAVLVDSATGTTRASGTGGTLTIEGVTTGCVGATLDVQLGTDRLTGDVAAVVCP